MEQKPIQNKDKAYVLIMLLVLASLTISALWLFWIQIPKVVTAVHDKIGNYQGLTLTTIVLVILDLMAIWGLLYLLREYRKRRNSTKK
jgi:membrane protein implicated in regulation of membrane protease activity